MNHIKSEIVRKLMQSDMTINEICERAKLSQLKIHEVIRTEQQKCLTAADRARLREVLDKGRKRKN